MSWKVPWNKMLFNVIIIIIIIIIINNIKHKLQINSRITLWKRCNTILLYQHVILHQFIIIVIIIRPIISLGKNEKSWTFWICNMQSLSRPASQTTSYEATLTLNVILLTNSRTTQWKWWNPVLLCQHSKSLYTDSLSLLLSLDQSDCCGNNRPLLIQIIQ